MFSLSFIAILVCVFSLSLSLCIYLPSSRMRSLLHSYYYRIAIIIDGLLIIGKGRGGLIPTSDKRKQERADLEVTWQADDVTEEIDKIYFLGLWRKETEIRIIIFFNNINKCKLFMIVMSSWNTNNNQSTLEGLIRAMPQLTERNQLM